MKRLSRARIIGALTLLPFALLALVLPPLLGLTGAPAWAARAIFSFLGVVAAGVVFWYLRARAKAHPEPTPADDEIDALLVQAKQRLAAGRKGAKLGKVPVVLLVGPQGGTKTTVVVRSGLDPELLAGEVYRGDAVVPSRVNVWFAEDAVFMEAGGRLLNEPSGFSRLIGHLQPSRLGALLPRGAQAPRLALVCFPCDEFLKPGAAQSVPALAQRIRSQLVEVAGRLGIRMPVYVLFTKADRVPYFADYVRSFTRDEANEVLGATLPLAPRAETGSYAEREAGRVGSAFDGIIRCLGLRRLDVLPRETAEDVRAGAYEFPRELRKVVPLATQFLVDLCRPTQLGVSPFLRGFYFTGVRALFTEDAPAPAQATGYSAPSNVEATSVFDPRAVLAQHRAPATGGGTRKVPEWAFLRRVPAQLLLRDEVARAMTAGGTRLNFLRRALVATAALALFLLCVGFVASWRNNDRVIDRTREAARSLEGVDLAGSVPSIDALMRLDTLRGQLVRVRQWETEGAGLFHRFGLYSGREVLARARPLYFDRFERLLWGMTRNHLVAALAALPSTPNEASEYGETYDALKAYLITSSNPQESTADFLAPELQRHWTRGRDVEAALADVANRQFAFYATELPHGDPYNHAPDVALVDSTRLFLRAFGNVDQFYQALLSEASKVAQPARFIPQEPVSDPVVVPGAFTREGYAFVQGNLDDVTRLFEREQWVLGDATVAAGDRAALQSELRRRYNEEYVRRWQEYIAGARMSGFGGAQDAALKLQVLGNRQSPLLRLFSLASQHTTVDTAAIGKAFQPVHLVSPAGPADQPVPEGTSMYLQGLVGLQSAVSQLAAPGAPRDAAAGGARSAADQVRAQVQQLALTFNQEGPAQAIGDAVQRLLLAPLRNVEGLLNVLPADEANSQGAAFCQRFAPLLRKYPFDARSSVPAEVEEISAMFKPGSSLLWSFYQESLSALLVQQGDSYGAPLGASLRATPAFEQFFNRAASVSRALYSADGKGPEVAFTLQPEPNEEITEIRVEIDGQIQVVNATTFASRSFIWEAAGARSARITATVRGRPVEVVAAQGPWAVFRMFHTADPNWETIGAGHYRVRWRLPDQNATLAAEVRFDKRIPIFQPGYFDRLACVPRIVAR